MKKMNKLCAMLILCTVILMSFPLQVNAESLWVDDSSGLNLFADRKARLVGDSLTIIIKESSNASRSGSSNNSKSGSNTLAAGTGIFDFLAAASASGEDKFQSSGKITNTNTVTGKIIRSCPGPRILPSQNTSWPYSVTASFSTGRTGISLSQGCQGEAIRISGLRKSSGISSGTMKTTRSCYS